MAVYIACVVPTRLNVAGLQRLFQSSRGAIDRWVVVDTRIEGEADDGTARLIQRAGGLLVQHPWSGSFCAARNAGLEVAERDGADWILCADSDYEMVGAEVLRDLVEGLAARGEGGGQDPLPQHALAVVTSSLAEGGQVTHRQHVLWQASLGLRFAYPVHAEPQGFAEDPVLLKGFWYLHHGWRGARMEDRLQLDLDRFAASTMDPAHPHRLKYEARALLGLGRIQEAVDRLLLLVRGHGTGEIPSELYDLWAVALLKDGRSRESVAWMARGVLQWQESVPQWLGLLRVAIAGLQEASVRAASGEGESSLPKGLANFLTVLGELSEFQDWTLWPALGDAELEQIAEAEKH